MLQTISYGYDTTWKDKLVSYNGATITYDAIGNPLNDGTWTYVWENGRQLKQMSKSGTTATFDYNHDGLRIRKIVNNVVTNYILHGKNIVHLNQESNSLHFFYDASGKPAIVDFNGTKYGYVQNLQGDIIQIIDANGVVVVEYTYDAWGKVLSVGGDMADTLGTEQPFRYRGYVYEGVIGFMNENAFEVSFMLTSFLVLLLIILMCPLTSADEYVLCGHIEPGVNSQWTSECYMPDGTEIILLSAIKETAYPDEDEMVAIKLKDLPDTEEIDILVSRADIINKNDYTGVYDLPKAKVYKRMPVFNSMDEKSREANVLIKDDIITVMFHIEKYYYIKYDGGMGFILDNAVDTGYISSLISDDTHRIYNSHMGYTELYYVEGEPNGNERIDDQQAIELAYQALIKEYSETEEHLKTLEVSISINEAHRYGKWGRTWVITLSGKADDYYDKIVLNEPQYSFIKSSEGISQIYQYNRDKLTFYTVEISVETGEIMMIHVGDLG